MTLKVEFCKPDGSETARNDLATVAFVAIVQLAEKIAIERYGATNQDVLELLVEVGENAQDELDLIKVKG